jgi:hypothetical protein
MSVRPDEVLYTYLDNPTTQPGLTDICRQSNITVNKRDLTDISRQSKDMSVRPGCVVGLSRYVCKT